MARSIPVNGADLLVLALENEGVKQIFGVPGEENLAMVEALRRSRIELVLTRHEQAAAFMAATAGRLSERRLSPPSAERPSLKQH
jgi:acetolactate synthase-1/2/3 large subunit